MYEMDLYCNSFSLLDPWEKCGSFEFSLGVCPTNTTVVTRFRGASCLVEDEHVRKRVILGGSATPPLQIDPFVGAARITSRPYCAISRGGWSRGPRARPQ